MNILTTSAKRSAAKVSAVNWERHWPLLVGVLAFLFAYAFAAQMFEIAERHKEAWHIENVYVGVFNFSLAAAAFLFAFYTYICTAEGAILDEIRSSNFFVRAKYFFVKSIAYAGVLSVWTYPYTVTSPHPTDRTSIWYWIVCFWVMFTVDVTSSVIRSLYHFVVILDGAFGKRFRP